MAVSVCLDLGTHKLRHVCGRLACSGQTNRDAKRFSAWKGRPRCFAVVKCVGSTGNKNPEINGCL